MAKSKGSIYTCSQCGEQYRQWFGKCPSCGAWSTLQEEKYEEEPRVPEKGTRGRTSFVPSSGSCQLSQLEEQDELRLPTGCGEFDRVLGGGIVKGSMVLVSGEPGIGKSTLLLQICSAMSTLHKVLYVSGEESQGQIKLRAKRLGVQGSGMYVMTETSMARIHDEITSSRPDVVIIDSIQTMYDDQLSSSPGSVTQVKEGALSLMNRAKGEGITVLIVGHVNKEGGIAGPKVLEHMVDTVLYFEGDRQQSYRIIRATKNRYGSTNEIGVFEMADTGMVEVENPSEMLLSGRPKGVSGNCAVCIMEGSRPIIAEVQALVTPTVFPSPRRMSTGVDYNRLSLLLAVAEKRLGTRFSLHDAYVNVVGGLRIDEPACDLAVILSLISCLKDKPVPDDLLALGEVGLSGEVRAVSAPEQRVKEAFRLGFRRAVLPHKSALKINVPDGFEIIPVRALLEAVQLLD
ncbi:MAG: DNA repair protein RadA [Eubacteriales bacterium]